MTTAQLLSRLRDLEVRLWAEEDRLCFHAPQGAMTPEIREALGRHKPEILVLLGRGRPSGEPAVPMPGPSPESEPAPLSFAQRRLWFLTQLEPESAAYNITRAARLEGPVRVEVLERCLAEVVRRHAILRTRFLSREGEPFQIAGPAVGLVLPVVDLQALPSAARRDEADRLASEEAQRPFDLTQPPPLRVFVLRLNEAEHVLPTSLHHIAGDAWSTAILFRELGALYEAFSRGLHSPLPEPVLQYVDYARWQRGRLHGALLDEQLAYWTAQLAEAPPSLDLPTDRPRSASSSSRDSSRGRAHLSLVPPATVGRLQAFARAERGEEGGTTPFMVLAAVFAVLLSRWSGQDDLVVGLPVANRGHTSLEGLIGLFLDTVALRLRLGGAPTFAGLLGRTRQATLGAYAHQDLPFERLVEALRPERQLQQTPIFQVVLSLQNVPRSELAVSSFRLDLLPPTNPSAQFDLVCDMEEAADGLRLSWRYRVDLFDATTIARLGEQFQLLLEAALDGPGRPVTELPLLDPARRHQLLVEWNGPGAAPGEPVCLHERFGEQAAARPDAVAVTDEALSLTYGELAARACGLARRLRALGVGPDVRVGVRQERSAEVVVSLLGVLKAGGAYVPLDPGYPAERLGFMTRDADLRVVVGEEAPAQILWVAEAPLRMTGGEHSLAYVIYTSGSTGRPKGVGVSHAAASRLFSATAPWFGFGPGDVWTLFHSFSFDFSVWEMWGALLHGGRVVIVPEPARRSPEELLGLLVREGVTVLDQTPSSFRQLVAVEGERPAAPLALRWVIFGGEALDFQSLAPWMARHGDRRPRLVNMYGITETTVHVTYRPITAADLQTPHPLTPSPTPSPQPGEGTGVRGSLLGAPIPDLQVYLVDARGVEPVPIGVPGEILVGGAGLARGYLGRPELTADRFRPHPWSDEPGARVYRSGDLARRRPDGDLEYLGRIDHQVKVRGFRVELGEVEAALAAFPGVRQAAAALHETAPGDRRLVGYVVEEPGAPLDLGALRAFLEAHLPGPFVPSALMPLPALPLTPGGKLDRAALARTGPSPAPAASISVPAGGPVAEALAGIWAEVLGLPAVGPGDDFFRLGGHSLLATAVLSRVRRAFRADLPVAALFEAPTLAGFAARIEGELRGGERPAGPPLVPRPRYGGVPLSFAQKRLWFLDRLAPGNPFYNVPVALRLRGELRPAGLEAALAEIVRRHEVLRSTLPELDGEPVQVAVPGLEVKLPRVDLSGLPAARREVEAVRLAEEEGRRPFDLAAGPLFRFALLRTDAGDHRLLLTLHHVVTDAWSMGVLRRELETFYEGGALPEPEIQYADFALWQRGWLAAGGLEDQVAWWRERLAGAPEEPGLPFDHPRPAVERFRGGAAPLRLSPGTAVAVRALARREGMTSFMVLLGAFQALLARLTGEADVVVGTPVANRARPEIEGLIGFFANTLVLRTDLSSDPDNVELLDRARRTALEAYAHQDLPFEALVDALAPERHLGRNPLFQVLLVYQRLDGKGGLSDLAGLLVDGAPQGAAGTGSAKFDLTLALVEGETGFEGAVEYDADLFEAPAAARMAGQLETLLIELVGGTPCRLGDLPLLSAAERHQLAREWNDFRDDAALLAAGAPVHAAYEAHAGREPETPAVIWNGSTLTYGELERASAALAARLQELGIGPGARVGLCVERSFAMPVGVLGILRAGAAYVPLDPEYPRERLAFMLEDLWQGQTAPVLVTHEWLTERLPDQGGPLRTVFLGESGEMDDLDPDDLPACEPVTVAPDDLVYVIYTSGSTGRPKGVALPHRALANLIAWHLGALTSGVRILGFSSLSFDASFCEMLVAWSSGGTLVLAGEDERRDPAALDALLRAERVEKATFPVVVLQQLAAEWDRLGGIPPELREIITTGERLQVTPAVSDLFQRRRGSSFRLHNHYGPSETHVATAWTLDADPAAWEDFPPIGRPIANATVHLLDAWGGPAALGAPGDLHIGGVCLARGYFGRPDLTAERFVPDPFAPYPGGARLYRTGDRARLRPDGVLEYQGRFDHQVKIRGFRVEPGEIEAALARHPAVSEAVAVPRDGRLVAYLVLRGTATPEPASLADFLRDLLPAYMVPSAFVPLPALPLNRNGKVDRRALPAPTATPDAGGSGRRTAPRTPTEEVVVAAWGEALGIEPAAISIHDDFFRLGGHSLLATRVVSRLRASFGVEVAVRLVFEASTVERLARRVEELAREGRGVASPPIRPVARAGPVHEAPLSFAQEWMWLADRLDRGGSAFLSPLPVRLRGRLEVPALERSVRELVRRHEMLRTTFPVSAPDAGGGPVQRIAPASGLALPLVDLQEIPEREEAAARLLEAELRRPLDLERGPLIRLLLLRLGPEEHHLLVTAHHILFDGWSNGLLLGEVAALYGAFSRGGPSSLPVLPVLPELPELPIQYADFAAWQRAWIQGETLERLLGYWRRELAGELPVLRLPGARPGTVATMHSARQTVELGVELSAAVQALARSRGTTVFTVLLAALQAQLHRLSGQEDILVGTTVAGRTRPEVEKLIGYFVNTLVLRARMGGDPTFHDLLGQVWETALGAWAHQDLPFTRLVAELRPDRAASRTPLFQVLFLLQNTPMPAAALPGLEMEAVHAEVPLATFDLSLSLKETPFGIAGWFFYNRDLFEPEAIALLAEGYLRLLAAAVAGPDRRLSELPVTPLCAAAEESAPEVPAAAEPAPSAPSPGGTMTGLSPEQRALLMLRLRRKAAGGARARDNLGP